MVSTFKILEKADEINSLNHSSIAITNSGYGELAWTIALVHRETQVYAFEADTDKFLVASHCSYIPHNLHFVNDDKILTKYDYLIDNQLFIK